nr:MAG TPA: hypothetical protein [Caudoviricetes sp.]
MRFIIFIGKSFTRLNIGLLYGVQILDGRRLIFLHINLLNMLDIC